MANQLARSLSPYLLQHQDNPVDWRVWSEEAFQLARERDVPIFLSVGYAACHWCHVMAHESFENSAIGDYLNEYFVSIKVDREERPDIDQIYMNAVQLMTGHGGWPMSVFLDHEARPFYAGTYWPPEPRNGMPGFIQVLDALHDAWTHRREQIANHAGEIHTALSQLAVGTGDTAEEVPPKSRIEVAVEQLLRSLDTKWGGFGDAPKFPHATDLELLLRVAARTEDQRLVEAVELTLDKMAAGGIRDHIGGGFARYSTDTQWLVPHFEKMLYDNALLLETYTRAYQVTGHDRHLDVAIETADYLQREMVDPCGGLHSSEDADSEGVEGKFYVWDVEEVRTVLGESRGERFCTVYGIQPGGNFEGQSIPHLPYPIAHWADKWSIKLQTLSEELQADRRKLRQARSNRVRPGRDDKIITGWNALAVRALAVVGAVADRADLLETAVTAARFLLDSMRDRHGRLLHAYRSGTAHLQALVDDYALTIDALLTLYESTSQTRWVIQAVELADQMRQRFEDTDQGGFFYTASDSQALITRNKDWHDGSLVSGNAAAATALLKLYRLTGKQRFLQSATGTLRSGELVLQKQSRACSALVSSLDRYHHHAAEWVIAIDKRDRVKKIRPQLFRPFRPNTTIAWVIDAGTDSVRLTAEMAAARIASPEQGAGIGGREVDAPAESIIAPSLMEGRAAYPRECVVYRCENYRCETPVLDPAPEFWTSGG